MAKIPKGQDFKRTMLLLIQKYRIRTKLHIDNDILISIRLCLGFFLPDKLDISFILEITGHLRHKYF